MPHSTQNSHFGDVSPSQSPGLVWEKPKPNMTKVRSHQSQEMYCNTKQTKKLKPGLVTFYDIRPGTGAGLFSKEKISKGGDK